MYAGRVRSLHRWPVKSLRGERLPAAVLDGRGLAGDRAYALIDERPERSRARLTVRQRPEMLSWEASYPATCDGSPEPPGAPVLYDASGAAWAWDDPALPAALSDTYGVPLSLRSAEGQQDRGPTVLVTFEASRRALSEEMGADVDVLRFRPNVHLDLDAPAFAEESMGPGTTVTIGDAVLAIIGDDAGPCIRCVVPSWDPLGGERWPALQKHLIVEHENKFGLIMRVTRPGTVEVGTPATLG
ncbi:molybdenum cofactor biosynthesis protein [Microtetraspora sp. NBRC 13810]|uniref:MOSC domain-containing protein n=1 Tax=Microtetraspora sp. NBRC 13810 TaxID=3030990 RepID=UPI0024A35D61|nr:MOSC N-terminal beta barrel domain-containing protein [Microtetraspora sp. NBRC 13810]GLW05648.1 molybdenum cofactor biosynthesis protein [Microtetraspora sp. NBRC 13810]